MAPFFPSLSSKSNDYCIDQDDMYIDSVVYNYHIDRADYEV